ncbi:MAG: glutathione S-transferase family protein [Candidatus Binatia bacterium]
MPKVYGINASPFVRKVRIGLAEKGIAYELEPVIPAPGMMPAGYEKLSPLKKVPAFQDGDVTLADSSVILAYVERTHPNPPLYPSDPVQYARALWFEEYGDGGLVNVTGVVFFQRVVGPRVFQRPTDEAAVNKAIEETAPPMFDYLESQLGKGDWFLGQSFTIGDIGVGSQLVNLKHAGFTPDTKRWPKLAAFVARFCERPSVRPLISEEAAGLGLAA